MRLQVNLRKRYFLAMLLYIPYILILLYLTLYVFPDRTMLLRSREARRAQLTATPAYEREQCLLNIGERYGWAQCQRAGRWLGGRDECCAGHR